MTGYFGRVLFSSLASPSRRQVLSADSDLGNGSEVRNLHCAGYGGSSDLHDQGTTMGSPFSGLKSSPLMSHSQDLYGTDHRITPKLHFGIKYHTAWTLIPQDPPRPTEIRGSLSAIIPPTSISVHREQLPEFFLRM